MDIKIFIEVCAIQQAVVEHLSMQHLYYHNSVSHSKHHNYILSYPHNSKLWDKIPLVHILSILHDLLRLYNSAVGALPNRKRSVLDLQHLHVFHVCLVTITHLLVIF